MTPREAAEQIVPSKERCKSGTMLLAREEAIAEIEQIIQAACDAAVEEYRNEEAMSRTIREQGK